VPPVPPSLIKTEHFTKNILVKDTTNLKLVKKKSNTFRVAVPK